MIILNKSNNIEAQGKVVDLLKGGLFKVELKGGHIVEAHVSGKMRVNNIRILPGDTVVVELSDALSVIGARRNGWLSSAVMELM